MNISQYDLYYSVIKNREEEEIVYDQHVVIEKDSISFIDLITPNIYIGKENNETLKWRILRSHINHINKFIL